jgi:hypothetical protein
MRAGERHVLRRVRVLVKAGDRAGALAALRTLDAPPRRPAPDCVQLVLSLIGDAVVEDCPLDCPVTATVCVARQIASENEVGRGPAVARTKKDPRYGSQAKRGRLASFVQCRTELCAVGAAARAVLGDTPEAVEMAKHAPRATDTSN